MADDLQDGEAQLIEDELFWRNAHPSFVDGDRLSSQVFRLTRSDQGKLSVAREKKVTAHDHYKEYVGDLGLESAGVWGVTVTEVEEQQVRVIDDSDVQDGKDRPQGHAYVDLRSVAANHARRIGSALRNIAMDRGRFYPD